MIPSIRRSIDTIARWTQFITSIHDTVSGGYIVTLDKLKSGERTAKYWPGGKNTVPLCKVYVALIDYL